MHYIVLNRKSLLVIFFPLAIILAMGLHAALGGFQPLDDQMKITPVSQPPAGKFLFVEIWVIVDGTGHLPGGLIDFPGYTFDPTTRVLDAHYSKNNYPTTSFIGLLGMGHDRRGDAGGGAASGLIPIATLPFSTTVFVSNGKVAEYSEDMVSLPVKLLAVSGDGLLQVKIGRETIILEVGKCWEWVKDAGVHNEKFDGVFHITSTLCNYGWLDLSQIAPR